MKEFSSSSKTSIAERFKNRLFYLFHNLLLYKRISTHLASILLYLNFVQLLVLTMNGKNPYTEAYFLGTVIEYIDVIQFYPLVDRDFGLESRIITTILILVFILLLALSLFLFSITANYKTNIRVQQLAYLMGYFYEFTIKLLFIPILGTFISTLKCKSGVVECFSGIYL